MKKLFCSMLLLLVLILALVGCSEKPEEKEKPITIGTYVMESSEEPILSPNVILADSTRFQFNFSVWSSYLAIGSYEEDGDKLILKTDDDKYNFVFKIKDNTLIFNAEESSELPSMANVPDDGAIFIKND